MTRTPPPCPPYPPPVSVSGKVYQNENGDVADDSYNKWKTDIQLMVDMKGLNAFRFSIAWARIVQLDGTINPAGIAHYNALIGECGGDRCCVGHPMKSFEAWGWCSVPRLTQLGAPVTPPPPQQCESRHACTKPRAGVFCASRGCLQNSPTQVTPALPPCSMRVLCVAHQSVFFWVIVSNRPPHRWAAECWDHPLGHPVPLGSPTAVRGSLLFLLPPPSSALPTRQYLLSCACVLIQLCYALCVGVEP